MTTELQDPPERPSECVAAVSLSEEGAEHPYLSIFYTVIGLSSGKTIYFFGLPVAGVEEIEEEKRLLFPQREGTTNDPDAATGILARGRLMPNGYLVMDHDHDVVLESESAALNFIAIIRALYQMQGELEAQDK